MHSACKGYCIEYGTSFDNFMAAEEHFQIPLKGTILLLSYK